MSHAATQTMKTLRSSSLILTLFSRSFIRMVDSCLHSTNTSANKRVSV